ncbi:MAG: lamin tail domain-containing protein [Lewinellaceae bacterium]|nr:lamin tail domain-containing protein [Lewinellaceae bacterium]
MKKLTLALLCSCCFALTTQAQIVLTEIMYNPPESNVDSLEYLEFYNNGSNPVNLEGWYLFGVNFTFPAMTLNPGEYVVTAVNATALFNQLGVTALPWGMSSALNNSGEPIILFNPAGDTIDRVAYTNMAPWPSAAGNGASLVLCDPNADNSLPENWIAATTPTGVTINGMMILANPGAPSDCPSGVNATNDVFVAVSGVTTNFDVLQNDNLPGQNNPVVSIVTPPQHGTATISPDNTIAYTPTAGYCGADVLTYQVCEGTDCDQGTVTITVRCYPAYSISQINGLNAAGVADSLGIFCELTATVYGVNLRGVGLQFTMIDDDGDGIVVFSAAQTFGYTVKEGDKITVRGSMNQFNGLLQILPDALTKISANNPLITPQVVQIHTEDTESKLIRINKLNYVDPAQWATGTLPGFSVFMVSADHPLDTILVRIDDNVDLFNQPPLLALFDLIGIGGQFDNAAPYDSGYQIAPRYIPDVSTLVSAKAADFSTRVSLSPNPAADVLRIQSDLIFDVLRIFDTNGRLVTVVTKPGQWVEIPVRDLANGAYLVQFEKDGAAWTTRFVKI